MFIVIYVKFTYLTDPIRDGVDDRDGGCDPVGGHLGEGEPVGNHHCFRHQIRHCLGAQLAIKSLLLLLQVIYYYEYSYYLFRNCFTNQLLFKMTG